MPQMKTDLGDKLAIFRRNVRYGMGLKKIFSQDECARILDMDSTGDAYQKYENGKSTIPAIVFYRLRKLGFDVNAILDGRELGEIPETARRAVVAAQSSQLPEPATQRPSGSRGHRVIRGLEKKGIPDSALSTLESPRPRGSGDTGEGISSPSEKVRSKSDKRRQDKKTE